MTLATMWHGFLKSSPSNGQPGDGCSLVARCQRAGPPTPVAAIRAAGSFRGPLQSPSCVKAAFGRAPMTPES